MYYETVKLLTYRSNILYLFKNPKENKLALKLIVTHV